MKKHRLSCLVLAISKELLDHGYFEMMKDIISTKDLLISSDICKFCSITVYAMKDKIFSSIKRILQETSGLISWRDITIMHKVKKKDFFSNESQITTDDKGYRSLIGKKSISRGTKLLTEEPLVSVLSSSCNCHEDVLLIEHIDMALRIYYQKSKNQSIYEYFINNLSSGMSYDIEKEKNKTDIDNYFGGDCWPIKFHCLVGLVSSIYSLFKDFLENTSDNFKLIDETESFNILSVHSEQSLIQESLLLFEIIMRLPTNIHSISKVFYDKLDHSLSKKALKKSEGRKDLVIEQVRIGFSLFLHASSVNHNCSPNSIIRFKNQDNIVPKNSEPYNDYTNQKLIEYLDNVQIELIATNDLQTNEEIFISYGVLKGKHQVKQRRQILKSQYLFDCWCDSCIHDLHLYPLEHYRSASTSATSNFANEDIQKTNFINQTHQELLSDIINIVRTFDSLKRNLLNINDQLNRLDFNHSQSSQLFYSNQIQPFDTRFNEFTNKYFSEDYAINFNSSDSNCPQEIYRLYMDFYGLMYFYYDFLAHYFALTHQFPKAVEFTEKSISVILSKGIYSDDSIELNRERVKLAQLLVHIERFDCLKKAKKILKKAISNLKPYVNPDDPDLVEASSLYLQLNQI